MALDDMQHGAACRATLRSAGSVSRGRWLIAIGLASLPFVGPRARGLVGAEIPVGAPGILDQPGATYLLTRDVASPGTCFIIKGNDITLDLQGHQVTYGAQTGDRRFGVAIPTSYSNPTAFPDVPENGFGGASRFRLRNGTIRQGAGQGRGSHGLHSRGIAGLEMENLTIHVSGPDTCNVDVRYVSDLRIHDNTFLCDVQVVSNRHYPGQQVIAVWGPRGVVEIHDNKIVGGPQWGIYVFDEQTMMDQYRIQVYRNDIRHDTKVTNGYAIGCKAPYMEVFDNVIVPRSGRGIQVAHYGCSVFRNHVEVREGPNPEYTAPRAHGIKLEGARRCKIYDNIVVSKGEPGTGPADAIDIDLPPASRNEVYQNVFRAISADSSSWAAAINLYYQVDGSGVVIRDNVFESNNRLIQVDWNGASGVSFLRNTFRFLDGTRQPATIYVGLSGSDSAVNNIFLDCEFEKGASARDVVFLYQTYRPDQVEFEFQSTLTLLVRDQAGQEVSAAQVRISETGAPGGPSTTTDQTGKAELVLPWLVRTPASEVLHDAYRVHVAGVGGVSDFTVDPSKGPQVLEVKLGSNAPTPKEPSPTDDRIPPKRPEGVGVVLE